MATPFHVELVTPERVLYSGDVAEVSMRTDGGEIAFLAHHEDFIGAAGVTVVRLAPVDAGEGATSQLAAVHGGFVHFEQDANTLTILAGVAELGSEVDVERARRALERADGAGAAQGAAAPTPGVADDAGGPVRATGTALATLAPDEPAAVAQRARARLEAAGASPGR
ncbi:MAG TPA: F0F1 ATP synthase subunit epsilon [Acidimicrobiales bacterium]|nr:F0F1 ATP synthase subunit epsilon [Acidimicrobiales bacterium]